jgi:hypothetical protein
MENQGAIGAINLGFGVGKDEGVVDVAIGFHGLSV